MEQELHKISKMVEQDLKGIAQELPYTGQDHFENLKFFYQRYKWIGVNDYLDTVYSYVNVAHLQPDTASFPKKISKWMSEVKEWLKSL